VASLPSAPSGPVLAVDVGGTKLAAGLVDSGGEVLRASRRPTPAAADGEAVWAALAGLLDEVTDGRRVAAVGVGCGGPMRWPAGEVSPLNIPGWRRFPLRDRLARRCPGAVVRVHNDAVCLAVAEHWRGAACGHDDALGMVVSTGVGGGLVLGGRLVDGGGVVQAGDLLLGPMREALRRHAAMDFTRDLPVVPAALGQEAGLVGAAALVLAGDAYWSADRMAP
jgi:predicted NBD/HSP70 family sugar kinase